MTPLQLVGFLEYLIFPASVLTLAVWWFLLRRLYGHQKAAYDPRFPVRRDLRMGADFWLRSAQIWGLIIGLMILLSSTLFFPVTDLIRDVIVRMLIIRFGLVFFIFLVLYQVAIAWFYQRNLAQVLEVEHPSGQYPTVQP